MGFLKNSGDIILDAVLTNAGRRRLARGDGSFKVSGFSLGDDEINYALFNVNASTPYADLDIMKTPILEAISHSPTALKHRLMTIARNDLLYLPIVKLNTFSSQKGPDAGNPLATGGNPEMYVIVATDIVFDAYGTLPQGFIDGRDSDRASAPSQLVVLDQGIDSNEPPFLFTKVVPDDLHETQFIIQVDDRFVKVVSPDGEDAEESFIDNDNIATYFIVDDGTYFTNFPSSTSGGSVIAGSRGKRFKFGLRASDHLANSDFLHKKFGTSNATFFTDTSAGTNPNGDATARLLDSVVRIRGNKTGMSIDVPIRFVRENS
jgi:hypothetical protein